MPRPVPTLRQRALAALARREYSRTELARKLAQHAESEDALSALLDALEKESLLSDERFAESLAHRRAARYGNRRIAQELAQHGLTPEQMQAQLDELAETEFERCKAVWQRKFHELPGSLEERSRQTRFLEARGFSTAVIWRVLKGVSSEENG